MVRIRLAHFATKVAPLSPQGRSLNRFALEACLACHPGSIAAADSNDAMFEISRTDMFSVGFFPAKRRSTAHLTGPCQNWHHVRSGNLPAVSRVAWRATHMLGYRSSGAFLSLSCRTDLSARCL